MNEVTENEKVCEAMQQQQSYTRCKTLLAEDVDDSAPPTGGFASKSRSWLQGPMDVDIVHAVEHRRIEQCTKR